MRSKIGVATNLIKPIAQQTAQRGLAERNGQVAAERQGDDEAEAQPHHGVGDTGAGECDRTHTPPRDIEAAQDERQHRQRGNGDDEAIGDREIEGRGLGAARLRKRIEQGITRDDRQSPADQHAGDADRNDALAGLADQLLVSIGAGEKSEQADRDGRDRGDAGCAIDDLSPW